ESTEKSNFSVLFHVKFDYVPAWTFRCNNGRFFDGGLMSRSCRCRVLTLGLVLFLPCLCGVTSGAPTTLPAPKVLQSSGAILADAQRRASSNYPSIASAIRA